jgi:Domain of unknown function (DUF4288)
MPWYSAHAILYVKFKDGKQDSFPAWENVYLINAPNIEEARVQAVQVASSATGDSQGTFKWNDRPAEWVFAGIRKILSVSHLGASSDLTSGDELTYSELSVPDEVSLRKLADGESVTIDYAD